MSTPAASAIAAYNHTVQFMDEPLYFQLIKLSNSAVIWVGNAPVMTNMSLAMSSSTINSNGQKKALSATTVLGDTTEDFACQLGRRLVQRFQMPFYVSWELPLDTEMSVYAERTLIEWLKQLITTA